MSLPKNLLSSLRAAIAPTASASPKDLSNESIAELIGSSPEAMAAFEAAYASFEDAAPVSENLFEVNSRQAAAMMRGEFPEEVAALLEAVAADLQHDPAMRNAIEMADSPEHRSMAAHSAELLAQALALPKEVQPQLTATAMVKDIDIPAYPAVLSALVRARQITDPKARLQATLSIQAMLDTFDLDPVMYQMLSQNPVSMGNWLPALSRAVASTGFFRIPETTVKRVPLPILQMSRLDYIALTPATMEIIDAWTREAFDLDPSKEYFIKTGAYSSKYDFRNCHIQGPQEVREIGRYLTYIQFQANQMASPLNQTAHHAGVSTTNEWVVREWIQDESDSPSIYHGMPLRTEFRVFIDADADEVLAVAPYWDPELMLARFEREADSGDPDMRHDAIVFRAHLPVLMERFKRFKDTVQVQVEAILPALDLTGQWSLDIMLNDEDGKQLYAIDMAPAYTSALSHHVPAGKLKVTDTDWLPQLGA